MNKENMKELLNRAREGANTPELELLVSNLESFIRIHEKREAGQDVEKQWLEAREKLWTTFEKATAAYGLSPEEIRDTLGDGDLLSLEGQGTLELLYTGESEKPSKRSLKKALKTRI